MKLQKLLLPIKDKLAKTEDFVQKNFAKDHELIRTIGSYSLNNKGKRLRPAIVILSNLCFGDDSKDTHIVAAILEYIHTASLMHDDVVDFAEYRRDQKTPHQIWGNQATILVGDYILARSLEKLTTLGNIELFQLITQAVAYIAKGEILQALHTIENSSTEKYFEVVYYKTASLLAAAMQTGGILAQKDEKTQKKLYSCGEYLGTAFQIVDDILDYKGEKTGKPIGKDFQEKKMTLPLCKFLAVAKPQEKKKIYELFSKEEILDSEFQEVASLMKKNNVFEPCLQEAQKHKNNAKQILQEFPKNLYQETLLTLADFITERLY
jgi:octaprenyl-diphosphate synthase